jgi:hypothetical protein
VYSAPPARISVAGAIPRSIICGNAITPTQPRATKTIATSHFGASIQARLRTSPAAAPTQTVTRTASATAPSNARSANGVYVPAIKSRIVEWSSRRIHVRTRVERQSTRW